MNISVAKRKPPEFLKPLLWSFKQENIDVNKHKRDIIVNAINYGTLEHWSWLIKTYGKEEIRRILEKRLETEFNPESRNLAKIIFRVPGFQHARRGAHR